MFRRYVTPVDLEHEMLWMPLSLSVSRIIYSSEHTDVSESSTRKVSFLLKNAYSNYENVTQIMSILRKNWDYLFNALKYNYTQENSLSKHTLFFSQPKTSPWKVVLWNVFLYEKRIVKIMFITQITQIWFPNFSSCLNNIRLLTSATPKTLCTKMSFRNLMRIQRPLGRDFIFLYFLMTIITQYLLCLMVFKIRI